MTYESINPNDGKTLKSFEMGKRIDEARGEVKFSADIDAPA